MSEKNPNIVLVLTGIVLVVAALLALGFAVYKASYTRRINKRLAEGRDAKIKPMMSPVKFVIVILASATCIVLVLWGLLIIVFTAKMDKQKKDMILYPSVHFYREDSLEDSLFAGYRFGDEIKGYNRFSKQYGDVKLEIYVTKNSFDVFPYILVASDYVGDEQEITVSEGVNYSFYNENWGNDICPDSLVAIDIGGYKGKFKFTHNVYYSNDIEYLLNEEPDESYEFDFRIHESGSIECPQLGLTVDSWD